MVPRLTVLLLGNTGVGKSASANTILQRKAFVSKRSFRPVTTQISEESHTACGREVCVVDTPGILTARSEVAERCRELLRRGEPCLFLVVVKVDRFTEEQHEAVRAAVKVLGPEGLQRSYLLFTGGDALDGQSLDTFIYDGDEDNPLPSLVQAFDGRRHLFNNTDEDDEQVRGLLVKSGHLSSGPAAGSPVSLEERRIVLLGLPGVGKSSSGNTILGSDQFRTGSDFAAVTIECSCASAIVGGRGVTVVDTPGVSGEGSSSIRQQMFETLSTVAVKSGPGPHAFVIVVRMGRLSSADALMFEALRQLFGGGAWKHAMVLFTHGQGVDPRRLRDRIQAHPELRELLGRCAERYCVFDNVARGNRRQVREFLHVVEEIVEANGGRHYSSEIFRQANTFIAEERNGLRHRSARQHTEPERTDEQVEMLAQAEAEGRLVAFLRWIWRKLREAWEWLCQKLGRSPQYQRLVPMAAC